MEESAEDSEEGEGDEEEAEEEGQAQAAVLDVVFGSVAAAQLADQLNLVTADFAGHSPSGKRGFTAGDVREIADS